jgi:hypothetical protein
MYRQAWWIDLVAGAISIFWAFVIYFYLPTDPVKAKGFSDRERYIAVARLRKVISPPREPLLW